MKQVTQQADVKIFIKLPVTHTLNHNKMMKRSNIKEKCNNLYITQVHYTTFQK